MWAVLISLQVGLLQSIPPPPSCSQLVRPFVARGVNPADIPSTPLSDPRLAVCPPGPSCCSRSVESALARDSVNTFKARLFNVTTSMATELDLKATQVDDFVYSLLNKAQREFHDMFLRTYGVMYENNAAVFQTYFRDLKTFYEKGLYSPLDSTDSFFNTLYQKMFQVLNGQYNFDVHYLACVSDNMETLRPFGDVPRKLASSVKRSLVAARALVKALRTGHEIANQMTKVSPSSECLDAVRRMSTCSACKGLPDIKPCPGLCINTMKGCLAYHYEIDELWNKYIESLMSLSERLSGPFNVEMTIEPISIKISDAIMNFQESGFQVTQKVFNLCGQPRLGKRMALGGSSQFVFEKRLDKSHRPPARPQKSEFERQMIDLKKKLKTAEGFWADVPYQVCDDSTEEKRRPPRNIENKESCWNGQEPGSYDVKIVEDGLAHQLDNTEVDVKIDLSHSLLNEQKFRLSNLANVLRSAFRGGDIEWWDEDEESEALMQDEGSGHEAFYGEYSDDEDGFSSRGDESDATEYGSGDHEEEEEDDIIVPAWTINKETEKADEKWSPWPKNPPTLKPDTVTERNLKPSSGATSVHLKNRMELAKAVITYFLPLATCYFGGFLADSPWSLISVN